MNNKNLFPKLIIGLTLILITRVGFSAVYSFDFTGRFTVIDPQGEITPYANSAGIFDPYGLQTPISASLTYDTVLGIGNAELVVAPFDFLGLSEPIIIHDMSLMSIGDNLILGNMLADWSSFIDMPVSIVWDATGLFNAFSDTPGGLQVGDVISGTQVLRGGEVINPDLQSALPATDGMEVSVGPRDSPGPGCAECPILYTIDQGPAPMATTTWNTTPLCTPTSEDDCLGVNPIGGLPLVDDGIAGSPMVGQSFIGTSISLDIGSGNSMVVTGVSAVPLPPALYFFGSGLLGLIGMARRRKA